MTQDAMGVEMDDLRTDRRTAMKVALGAAAAGVAWSAPKIEGLSLSPDYASAASRPGTANGALVSAHVAESASGSAYECTGHHNGGTYGSCTNWSPTALTINTPVKPNGPSNVAGQKTFTLNATLSGQVKNTGSTSVNWTSKAGWTNWNNTQSCVVTISGNCALDNGNIGGTAGTLGGTGSFTLNAVGQNTTNATKCNGNALYIKSTITVNVACSW